MNKNKNYKKNRKFKIFSLNSRMIKQVKDLSGYSQVRNRKDRKGPEISKMSKRFLKKRSIKEERLVSIV